MKRRASVDVFQALSDPTRRQILDELARRGELRVKHLVESTGRVQPMVSKHLDILIEAGLVAVREFGRIRRFSLEPSPLEEVKRDIARWEKPKWRLRKT